MKLSLKTTNHQALALIPLSEPQASAPRALPFEAAKTAIRTKTRATNELIAIKQSMCAFLLTHMPPDAEAMLDIVEVTNSYAKLNTMLKSYADMAGRVGVEGMAHIRALRALIHSH